MISMLNFYQKENDFGADICYFKVVDADTKTKLKQVKAVEEDEIRMPYWKQNPRGSLY